MGNSSKKLTLYHGSSKIVPVPTYGIGNPYNDYGLGFYCTENRDLAKEWACPIEVDGFVNKYSLDIKALSLINIHNSNNDILEWLSLLVKNRQFETTTPLAESAKSYLNSIYPKQVDKADVVIGYRADDSYFSFARAFLDNRISLRQLSSAMHLGNLGNQVVIKSRKAFEAITFISSENVNAQEWYPKRWARDKAARQSFKDNILADSIDADDIFIIDIMRKSGWI